MIAPGNNAHIFARPSRRPDLVWCFETALRCGPVRTIEHPAMPVSMLLVDFPGGGHLSIEFIEDGPDEDRPRLGAWLELRVDDPALTMRSGLEAGLTEVKHPGHPYYLMAPWWSQGAARGERLGSSSWSPESAAADVIAVNAGRWGRKEVRHRRSVRCAQDSRVAGNGQSSATSA